MILISCAALLIAVVCGAIAVRGARKTRRLYEQAALDYELAAKYSREAARIHAETAARRRAGGSA